MMSARGGVWRRPAWRRARGGRVGFALALAWHELLGPTASTLVLQRRQHERCAVLPVPASGATRNNALPARTAELPRPSGHGRARWNKRCYARQILLV